MSKISLTGKYWREAGVRLSDNASEEWVHELLAHRGLIEPEVIEHFFHPTLQHMPDPSSMRDIERGTERIARAIMQRERVTVYGDYDVDGVCSASLLVSWIRDCGGEADYYIPERKSEGYGLNIEAVRQLAQSYKLMVTVDCGSTSVEEIACAHGYGMDVVVVDHHLVPEPRPSAYALLNPHQHDCSFPFKFLCAGGMTFVLAVSVRRYLRESGWFVGKRQEPDMRQYLDLVALATVADMVPLQGLNRIFVATGLKIIEQRQRIGLAALLEVCGLNGSVRASDLGFKVGPRVNARGRLSHAGLAVDLMLTRDREQARAWACNLDSANRERQALEKVTVQEAIAAAEQLGDAAGYVLCNPNWHPGILGLAASRVSQKFHRPTVVIGEGNKGSGRSIEGVNLYQAISAGAAHLVKFGGHAAAAGLTLATNGLEPFRALFCAAIEDQMGMAPYRAEIKVDIETALELLNTNLVYRLQHMQPFGMGNHEPVFMAKKLKIQNKRVLKNDHLKLQLGDRNLDAIGFGLGHLSEQIQEEIDAIFYVDENEFRGSRSLQLRLIDIRNAS